MSGSVGVAVPYLVGLAAGVAVVGGLIVLQGPPVTRGTVFAVVPWMIVGALLDALASTDVYAAVLAPLVQAPLAYVTGLCLGGAVWLPLLQFAAIRQTRDSSARYLAAAGAGTAFVLAVALVWHATIEPRALVWLAVAPVAAALLASVGYFLLGLGDAAPLAYTRLVGLLVVFAHAFDGLAVAVAVDVFGTAPRSPVAAAVTDLARTLPTAAVSVGWAFALVKLLFALAAVWLLADYTRRAEARGYLLLGALAAAGIGPGLATLLALAVG